MHFKEIDYGFEYGSAVVTRFHSDEKKGWVIVEVKTPRGHIQVYVTRSGLIRVHDSAGEWTPPKAKR